MSNKDNGYTALFDFVGHWREQDLNSFVVQATGNAILTARVTYEWKRRSIEDVTKVYLIRNGYEDGKVTINPTDILETRLVHGNFELKFGQVYTYDEEDHTLTIEGSSKQMGEYKVKIEPLDA